MRIISRRDALIVFGLNSACFETIVETFRLLKRGTELCFAILCNALPMFQSGEKASGEPRATKGQSTLLDEIDG